MFHIKEALVCKYVEIDNISHILHKTSYVYSPCEIKDGNKYMTNMYKDDTRLTKIEMKYSYIISFILPHF